jgi:type I restriction-modification system DNA methylase subunit
MFRLRQVGEGGQYVDGQPEKVGFIWSVADLLRGGFKPSDYGKVILPFTVLRRLDCLLEPTKTGWVARPGKMRIGALRSTDNTPNPAHTAYGRTPF